MDNNEFDKYRKALTFAVPVLLFMLFFTPAILDPTRVGWLLDGDWGQHFLGWHAYRQTPLGWPFNYQTLLSHPTGLSLLYTDSNPLVSIPMRWLSGILPEHFQFIGWWFLACIILHYFVAYRLVARHAPGPWSALAGATLLTLLPTLYMRIGHDTLCAHWLILSALYIFFEIRNERRKLIGYACLMGLTGLIHPYLLFMILAVWGADQLRVTGLLLKNHDWKQLAIAVGLGLLTLVPPAVTLGISGAYSGQSAASDGFGVYGMPLDAIFNPSRKDFAFALLNGPQPPRMAFEGFQYLGAGLLVLLGAAIWLYRKSPAVKSASEVLAIARPLKWPFIVLLVLAITDQVHLYSIKLVDLSFPTALVNLLNIVRASGRLFWPIAYTLVFLSLICIYRAQPRTMGLLLGAVLVLQLFDMAQFATNIRALTGKAATAQAFALTPSKQWDAVMAHTEVVSFQPAVPLTDKRAFYEIILHALDHKVPVNMMYAARENPHQDAIQRREYLDFRAGKLNPRRLYVMLGKAVPAGLEGRVREIDGIWIIPPQGAEAGLARPKSEPFETGKTYIIGAANASVVWFGNDWEMPQVDAMNSKGHAAVIAPTFAPEPGKAYRLTLSLRGWRKAQILTVAINGVKLKEQRLGKKAAEVIVDVPASAFQSRQMQVALDNLRPAPEPGEKPDTKEMGVEIYSLRVDPL
jgi:hypothetical protein